MRQALKDMKISRVKASVAAGQTDQDSSVLDMSGFDGVVFVALTGDVADTSVLSVEVRESVNADGSSDTLVAGSKTTDFTADATSADSKIFATEYCNPAKRYVFCKLRRGTANAVVDGIIAIQYRTRHKPVTQPAELLASALVVI